MSEEDYLVVIYHWQEGFEVRPFLSKDKVKEYMNQYKEKKIKGIIISRMKEAHWWLE